MIGLAEVNETTNRYELEFQQKVSTRTARVGIVGLGYVGLPLSLMFSEQKIRVTGFDIDAEKVNTLTAKGSYIARIGPEEIAEACNNGFTATTDFSQIANMDAIIICVPTPLNQYHEPDLSYIVNTAKSIAPHLRAGQLVVLQSTTYPGTTEELLIPILEKENRAGLLVAVTDTKSDNCLYVAFSPEREDPGRTDIDRQDIPKVIGGMDPTAAALAGALYGSDFQSHCSRIFAGRGGDDQAP
jgi:UDP-N-acetyl-D-glucosamine dehydrogenase